MPNGNVLVVDAGYWTNEGSELIEVDRLGNIVWQCQAGLRFAHGCCIDWNGNFLVADTLNNRIVSIDRAGEVVWSSESWGEGTGRLGDGSYLAYPNDVHLTPEGDMLITDRNNNRVVVASCDGRVLWSYDKVHHPHNADLVPNGNVLLASSDDHQVIEVDKNGRTVWSFGQSMNNPLNWPRDADRLPNGNTLIADSRNHRAIIVSPRGEIVWEHRTERMSLPYEVDYLPNGNILYSDQRYARVLEIDQWGNIVWCFRNFYRPSPLSGCLVNGGFDEGDTKGGVLGWSACDLVSETGAEFIWGPAGDRSGKAVGIRYRGPAVAWWQQTIALRRNRPYVLRAWARSLGVSGGAQVQLAFLDELGGFLDDPKSLPGTGAVRGDSDWTQLELEFVSPARAVAVDLRAALVGAGEAWFDDVELSEITWA